MPKQKMVSVRVDRDNYRRLVVVMAYLMSKSAEDVGFNEAVGAALDDYYAHAGSDFKAVKKNVGAEGR